MYKYNKKFYDWIDNMVKGDAEVIMPYLIQWINPRNIVDFGCGEGIWLEAARGLDENISVLGIDGDYVDRGRLKIPSDLFMAADLSKPLEIKEKYDLAISTEVAEHIEERYSEQFVDNITSVADRIFFTAATPGQDGVNHINEQWQSYWIEKFGRRGYFIDLSVRNFFWNRDDVTDWRRKNILYFTKCENESIAPYVPCFDVVHPESYRILEERLIASNAQYLYTITHLEVVQQLDKVISEIVQKYENIVIYPYGKNGKICKTILNGKYGIQEYAIVDNIESERDVNILSAKGLEELQEDFVIIDTCSNPKIHEETLECLRHFVNKENIVTVFKESIVDID